MHNAQKKCKFNMQQMQQMQQIGKMVLKIALYFCFASYQSVRFLFIHFQFVITFVKIC